MRHTPRINHGARALDVQNVMRMSQVYGDEGKWRTGNKEPGMENRAMDPSPTLAQSTGSRFLISGSRFSIPFGGMHTCWSEVRLAMSQVSGAAERGRDYFL